MGETLAEIMDRDINLAIEHELDGFPMEDESDIIAWYRKALRRMTFLMEAKVINGEKQDEEPANEQAPTGNPGTDSGPPMGFWR